jgi:hypothetical protein
MYKKKTPAKINAKHKTSQFIPAWNKCLFTLRIQEATLVL